MAFKRFISTALAGLLMLSSVNTGSLKVYAASDEYESFAEEIMEAAEDFGENELMDEAGTENDVDESYEAAENEQAFDDTTPVEDDAAFAEDDALSAEADATETGAAEDTDDEIVEVVFDANGGLFDNQEQTVTFSVLKGTPLSEIQAEPVKEGFEFNSWFLDAEFTIAADPNEFVVTENAVFFARWQEAATDDEESTLMVAESGIYLDANGGRFPDGTNSYYFADFDPSWNTNLDFARMKPTKGGEIFVGWYKESSCETRLSTDYNPYELSYGMGIKANDRIYAKYSADFSTVTFVYGSGKDGDKGYYWNSEDEERVPSISINVLNGKTIGSAAGAGNYSGSTSYNNIRNADPRYSFSEYWYEDAARNTEAIRSYEIYNRTITADLTVYAGYVENKKVINFHSGESTAFFSTEVYDREEISGQFSESAYTTPKTQSGDYRIYTGNFLSTGWVYNTDPSKDIEGFYLSEDFKDKLEISDSGHITVPRNTEDVWVKWASTKPVITFVANGAEEGFIWHIDPHTGEESKKDQVEFALKEGTYNYYNVGELKSSNPRWKFLGWSEDKEATSADERFDYYKSGSRYYTEVNPELTENTTLYGVWDKNYYWIVTFKAGDKGYFEIEADDGTTEHTNEYVRTITAMSEGSSIGFIPLIPKIDDPKLGFSEWAKEDGSTTGRSYVQVDRDNMIFTAVYDAVYTVTLHADDDERSRGGYYTDDDGKKVARKEIISTQKAGTRVTDPPTDKNYKFGGWYEDPEFTTRANVNYSYYYPDKEIDLYARWLKICSVTFDAGEKGTIDINSSQTYVMEKAEGEKICRYSYNSLPVAVPKDGNTLFVAWVIKQDGGTEVRYKNSEVRDYEVSGDVTFTATYNEAVDVKFIADGGFVNKDATVAEITVKVPKGEAIGTKVPTPRDIDGETPKVFKGWFDKPESDGGKEIINLYNLKPEKTTVLYAGYADCNVVTFHANNEAAKAVFDNGSDTFKVLVPKGKAFEYTQEGAKWKTQAAPEISYDSTYTNKVLLCSSAGAGNPGWSTNASGSGDIYYLNDGYSYVVEEDGSVFYFEGNGFVPTGNTDFYGVWVPETEVTFTLLADGDKGKTFDEEKVKNSQGWKLSDDKKSITYKVPSGIRFDDFYGPSAYYVSDPPEDKYVDWGYDSKGTAIPSNKKITTKTTITNKWIKEEEYIPKEEKTVTLHAGKGYFGSKGYEYAVDTEGYVIGGTRWVSVPMIDDPNKAFIGYSTEPDGTTADYGTQKFDMGWSITYSSEVTDLYAVYGPTATLTLDANGGFFAGSSSSLAEYDEEYRENTSVFIKPSIATSAGATISLQGYTAELKHDGNKVFDGWTLKADGTQPLPLSTTNMDSMVFTASLAEPVTAYAQWTEVTDGDIPATLTLNVGDQKLNIGDVKDLAEVLSSDPKNFKDKHNIKWGARTVYSDESSSSAKSSTGVVSISESGKLTALSEGKVKVWAESNGRRSNEITVTVTDSSAPTTPEITVDTSQKTIEEGQTLEVNASVTPATESGNLEWKSSAPTVATVSYEGAKATIRGVAEGDAKISVQVKGKTDTAKKFVVKVVKRVDPIRIEGETIVTLTAKQGNIAEFVAALNEANKGKKVVWESSSPEELSVKADPEDSTKAVIEVVKDLPVKKTVTVTARIEGAEDIATVEALLNPQKSAEAPKANPSPENEEDLCEVLRKELIELSTGTTDASIFYTTDGSTPQVTEDKDGKFIPASEAVKVYQDALRIAEVKEEDIKDGVVTVKAIAVKKGLSPSETATFKYLIKTDSWGDLAKDSRILEKAKEWFNNDSNNVPQDVWFVQQAQDELKKLEDDAAASKTYTGSKITFNQEIVVYHGTRQLIENRDYTITYKNNINVAGATDAKAPTFTVKGKGQYSSVKDFRFEITPESIKEALLASEKNIVVIAGKNVKLGNTKPVVTYNGKKLTEGKDYTLKYYKVEGDQETTVAEPAKEILSEDKLGADGEAHYTIKVTGAGNFIGTDPELETNVEVIKKDKNIVQTSKLKVVDAKGKAVAVEYTGTPLDLEKMFDNSNEETAQNATAFVKNGKNTLIYGTDYVVEAAPGSDLTSAGKQQIVIKGKAKSDEELDEEGAVLYVGEKTATIDIKAEAAINKAKVAGLKATVEYIGRNFTNEDLDSNKGGELFNKADKNLESGWDKVTLYTQSGKTKTVLVEGQDYDVEAFDTGIVGKFTIIFKGKNGCTGTLKKTVTVKAANLKGKKLDIKVGKVKFVKTGAKPNVQVNIDYGNGYKVPLKQGIDFNVTYKNNTKVFSTEGKSDKELKQAPSVTVKGIGNYSGAGTSETFTIEPGDPEQITAFVKDVVYNKNKSGKSGYFLTAPKLMDNGKAITAGKGKDVKAVDKKAIKYTYFEDTELEDGTTKYAGSEVGAKDAIPAGTIIAVEVPVTITSKSPYYNAEGSDPIKTTIAGTYRVIGTDISKAKITVKNPDKLVVNNGEAVRLTKEDITVKIGNGELDASDYDIVSTTNNTGVGSMTITIAGKGNYGGTKSQSFKVKAKSMN